MSGSPGNLPIRTAAFVFLATSAYAVVRYHLFGGVDWSQLPVFVLNKSVSWTALLLISLSYLTTSRRSARKLGTLGFTLVGLHVILSLAILNPANYPKLYEASRLTLAGGLCILAGSLGALLLCLPAAATVPGVRSELGETRWLFWQRAGYAALGCTAVHCVTLGAGGWLKPETWPGGLPPISMLSFLAAAAPLLWRLIRLARPVSASPETHPSPPAHPEKVR